MNKLVSTIMVLALCSMVMESYAQDKAKKNEAHIKVVTEHNGKTTKIDTVINLNDLEGNIHEVLERFNLDDELKAATAALKDVNIDINVDGEEIDMSGVEEALKWIGEAMEDMDFNIDFDTDENITITTSTSDKGTKTRTKMMVISDENGYSYETIEGDNTVVDVDLDGGQGRIIIKSKDGSEENTTIFIDEGGTVEVVGVGEGSEDMTVQTRVKMIELDADEHHFITDDDDEVDVTVITDKDGNKEMKVIVKTIEMNRKAADINAPELPTNLDLQVYPNPNHGSFVTTFRNDKKAKTVIRVFDTKGAEVYTNDLGKIKGVYSENLDLDFLKSGNYIMKVEQGKSSTSQQFIIH
ncbi:MAG: hypothetical protein ACI9YU_000339 [Flavobacteriales bacterium]|jgi:hypothetical protein